MKPGKAKITLDKIDWPDGVIQLPLRTAAKLPSA